MRRRIAPGVATRAALGLLAALALGCNGPVFLFPGGALDGTPAAVPASWSAAGAYGTGQLETRPGDPYSVNIAYTVLDDRLYINAGDTETQWAKNIAADADVRFRIDGALYDLRARRVTDDDEVAAFAVAWTSQSMFRRDPSELDEVWIYELVAR